MSLAWNNETTKLKLVPQITSLPTLMKIYSYKKERVFVWGVFEANQGVKVPAQLGELEFLAKLTASKSPSIHLQKQRLQPAI